MGNPDMADIEEEFKTKKITPRIEPARIKRRATFKNAIPKKLRKEWGERMQMLRSIAKET